MDHRVEDNLSASRWNPLPISRICEKVTEAALKGMLFTDQVDIPSPDILVEIMPGATSAFIWFAGLSPTVCARPARKTLR